MKLGEGVGSDRGVREELERSGFEVGINRERLSEIEGIPEEMEGWLTRLPERLHFRGPITFIFGEN